jgi:hypothetical protein
MEGLLLTHVAPDCGPGAAIDTGASSISIDMLADIRVVFVNCWLMVVDVREGNRVGAGVRIVLHQVEAGIQMK